MERIFGPDGVLRMDADPDCVFAVRQICLFAKKLQLPCTSRRERAAESAYVSCEETLRSHVQDDSLVDAFRRVSRVVWGDLLGSKPSWFLAQFLIPQHGPGTTVEGLRGNGKFVFPSWPQRLDRYFPFAEFGIGSMSNWLTGFDDHPVRMVSARDELPVRVVFVPKTQKSPRVIGIEPVCMQYIQQSITSVLTPMIEHHGSYTKGRVNFSDQSINARLALQASIDGRNATLDMSDASDRVSASLVWKMLECHPEFRACVFACRSTRASLPNGHILPLRKFASMGSALCFPMEAMVFFCTIVTSRIVRAGARISPSSVRKYSKGVFVYGDDIIVPADEAPDICSTLNLIGFRVNAQKSFWSGNFRESCGMDAFAGVDVTPVYVRRMLPADVADSHGIASLVSLANQFYLKRLWGTCRFLRLAAEKLLGRLPTIGIRAFRHLERVIEGRFSPTREHAGLGWISYSNGESSNGWDVNAQCLKSKRWVVSPRRKRDPLEGDAALLKCFGCIGNSDIDPAHLRESVRYGALALKRRWVLV